MPTYRYSKDGPGEMLIPAASALVQPGEEFEADAEISNFYVEVKVGSKWQSTYDPDGAPPKPAKKARRATKAAKKAAAPEALIAGTGEASGAPPEATTDEPAGGEQ